MNRIEIMNPVDNTAKVIALLLVCIQGNRKDAFCNNIKR